MAKQTKKRKKAPKKVTQKVSFETQQKTPKSLIGSNVNIGSSFNSAPKRSSQSGRKR